MRSSRGEFTQEKTHVWSGHDRAWSLPGLPSSTRIYLLDCIISPRTKPKKTSQSICKPLRNRCDCKRYIHIPRPAQVYFAAVYYHNPDQHAIGGLILDFGRQFSDLSAVTFGNLTLLWKTVYKENTVVACVPVMLAVAFGCFATSCALLVVFATVSFQRGTLLDIVTKLLVLIGTLLFILSVLTGNIYIQFHNFTPFLGIY